MRFFTWVWWLEPTSCSEKQNKEFLLGFVEGIKGTEVVPALVQFLFLLGEEFSLSWDILFCVPKYVCGVQLGMLQPEHSLPVLHRKKVGQVPGLKPALKYVGVSYTESSSRKCS